MENTFILSERNLADLLAVASRAGSSKILEELGLKKSQISQREAYTRYGKAKIISWLKSGQIVPARKGKTLWYDTSMLEILMSSSSLCNEPPVKYGIKTNK